MKEVDNHLLHRFREKLQELTEGSDHCRILLAVSGGVDSMVLVRLFSLTGKTFGIAHCNFMLRQTDSDLDEQMVKRASMMIGVPYYSAQFDTQSYALEHKLTIQEAARNLRYGWLNDIAYEHHYALIATGHHLDDSVETMLINLIRGTGIGGLGGIPEKRQNIIRPLLFATRAEIEQFASDNGVEFRTDQSNLGDYYLRNRIRHHVVPPLKDLNPAFYESMTWFFEKMRATQTVLNAAINSHKAQCIRAEGAGVSLSIKNLLALPRPDFYLYAFLKEYGFSFAVCSTIFKNLKGQPGARYFSKTHAAIKDREKIFVTPLNTMNGQEEFLIDLHTRELNSGNTGFAFETGMAGSSPVFSIDENEAILDFDLLTFPLLLRKIRPGDRMQPLGMKGVKKISDLLTDKKVPRHIKNNTWVLVSKSEIVWLAGYRMSEKYKITGNTKKVFIVKTIRG